VITGSCCIRASPTGGWPAAAAFDGPLPEQSKVMAVRGYFGTPQRKSMISCSKRFGGSPAKTTIREFFFARQSSATILAPAIERGYEVQIDDRGFDPETGRLGSSLHRTGAIYKLAPAPFLLSRAVGRWNAFTITARGRLIRVELNGRETARLDDSSREPSGHIARPERQRGARPGSGWDCRTASGGGPRRAAVP
jgi:hypothetical protein